MSNNVSTRPVHEIRLGRIKAAIWENETQNGTRHNVTITRLYRDGDVWRDSSSFGRDDLPVIVICPPAFEPWRHPGQDPVDRDLNVLIYEPAVDVPVYLG